jgi:hypothetical protein
MANTTNRVYPYPVPGSDPDVPYWIQQLAEKLDVDVKSVVDEMRTTKPFGHMGRTAAFQGLLAATNPTPVTVGMSAAQELRGGMTFIDAEDCLVVPLAGVYDVRIKGYFTGAAEGNCQQGIKVNGTKGGGLLQGPQASTNKMDGNDIYPHSGGRVRLVAGDKVALWQSANTSVSTWGTNGYDGAWLELTYSNP